MATVIERAALVLEHDGYITAWMHEGRHEGIVAFLDPKMLGPAWRGPKIFGLVRFTAQEIHRLNGDPNSKSQIYHRAQEAKQQLLEDIQDRESEERAYLGIHAVKLSAIL